MNPIPALTPHLKQLRLSGILDSLEARNRQAIESKLAYTEFLALLIEDEVARREQKKFASRLRRAAFRTNKTLDQFEFDRLPQLNRALVHDLASGRYLSERAPVLIVGPCGTGKSHLAQALGHSASICPSGIKRSRPTGCSLPQHSIACVTTPTASYSTALRIARPNSFLQSTNHGLPTRRNQRILNPATMSVRPAKHWRLNAGNSRLLYAER
jgi:DNA replication protein DnaC